MYYPEKAGDEVFREMYVQYWIRFEENFNHASANRSHGDEKIPGIPDGYPHAGEDSTGRTAWTTKPVLSKDGNLVQYTYHMEIDPGYGDPFPVMYDFPTGKWLQIIQRVKLNTVTNGDADPNGILQV